MDRIASPLFHSSNFQCSKAQSAFLAYCPRPEAHSPRCARQDLAAWVSASRGAKEVTAALSNRNGIDIRSLSMMKSVSFL